MTHRPCTAAELARDDVVYVARVRRAARATPRLLAQDLAADPIPRRPVAALVPAADDLGRGAPAAAARRGDVRVIGARPQLRTRSS